jgi:DNA-binding IclR family transcriptional regulator
VVLETKGRSAMRNTNVELNDRNHLVWSVASALEIIEILGNRGRPMAVSLIARIAKRPKSSVHRMLSTFTQLGFVEQMQDTGHYRLTIKLWSLASGALHGRDFVEAARPHLDKLMLSTAETVHLAVLEGFEVIYMHKAENPRSIRVQTRVGSRAPAFCTATGRAIVAFHPQAQNLILRRPRPARTEYTTTDADELREIFNEIAMHGVSITRRENHPEIGGIAAPIRDYTGNVIASAGVALPAFRMDEQWIERCVPLVRSVAAKISNELGFRDKTVRTEH